ncbi:MAG TPA: hypothetical protein VHP83_08620 [Aggregatilineaceae bacterium]|nr:hypothetical protein [Aggregatilineaceae bacterium]
MKKMIGLVVALVLLTGGLIQHTEAAAVSVAVNFDGATIGVSCAEVIDADPYLIVSEDGTSEVINTTNAGGSAPECLMHPSTVFRIEPVSGAMFTGVSFLYSGMFHIEFYNSQTSTVVYSTDFSGAGVFTYPGSDEFDDIYLRSQGEGDYFDNAQIVVNDPNAGEAEEETVHVPGCDQAFTILSSALITTHQPGFWKPGGDEIVLADKTKLDLLHDVDQNGQDEYLVVARGLVGEERWVGLFIGACQPVYVPLAKVTLLRPMTW